MAKKRPASLEEAQERRYKERKRNINREANIATALIADKRFPTLKKFILRESQIAAGELAAILKNGTKRVMKGDIAFEEAIGATEQLIEARCLAYKCNFLNVFIRNPEAAIAEKVDWDEREKEIKEATE